PRAAFKWDPLRRDNVSQQQNNFSILDTISYNLGHHQLRFGGEVHRVNMDKNFPQLFNGLVVFAPTPPDPTVPNDPCALSPIGFAYDVLGRHTTAIRGGYGIYYEREDNGAVDNLGFSSPFLAGSFGPGAPGSLANLPAFSILPPAGTISPDFVPSLSHFLGFADCGLADITQCSPNFDGNSIFLIALQTPRHYVSPNVQQWNLTLQRQLPLKWLMEIGYVGTKGTHLRETRTTIQPFLVSPQNPITLTANGQTFQITQNTVANAPARSRVLGLGPSGMQFFGNDADSHYHSLQATVSRRMDRIYLQGAYTFSKSIDDNSSDTTAFNTAFNDQTNLRASLGL